MSVLPTREALAGGEGRADHLFGPTAFDVLAWAGLALVAVRVGRTGDTRWWVLGGLILGLGLANKHGVGLFAVALLIGAGKPTELRHDDAVNPFGGAVVVHHNDLDYRLGPGGLVRVKLRLTPW